jgi:NitT/TauT family transport system permease protein
MADPGAPVPFRGGGFAPKPKRAAAWITLSVILAVWQAASSGGLISATTLPSPAAIGQALWALAASGDLARHLGASLSRLVLGWLSGTLAGLIAGFAIGMWGIARSIGLPVVSAIFPIPKIALLPLFIIWFGIGEPSKIAVIFFGVFFPTAISAYGGVDNVPRSLIRMGQSFNLPMRTIIWRIIVPGALPAILPGLRISAAIAIVLLTAAEMLGAQWGVGSLVLLAGNLFRTDLLLAGAVLLSLIGVGVGACLTRLERWLLRWR